MSTDEFEQELNSIVNGYTQSFLEIDLRGCNSKSKTRYNGTHIS